MMFLVGLCNLWSDDRGFRTVDESDLTLLTVDAVFRMWKGEVDLQRR